MRDLPRLAAVSKEAVAMSQSFLEKRGYVAGETESPGGRLKTHVLTPKGQRALNTYGQKLRVPVPLIRPVHTMPAFMPVANLTTLVIWQPGMRGTMTPYFIDLLPSEANLRGARPSCGWIAARRKRRLLPSLRCGQFPRARLPDLRPDGANRGENATGQHDPNAIFAHEFLIVASSLNGRDEPTERTVLR